MKSIQLADLQQIKPNESIVVFPIKDTAGNEVYYKIKELTIAENNHVRSNALKQTMQDLSVIGIDIAKIERDKLTDYILDHHKQVLDFNTNIEYIIATTYDTETDKKIFQTRKDLISCRFGKDVIDVMVANYIDFTMEYSPSINQVTKEEMDELVRKYRNGEINRDFFLAYIKNWNPNVRLFFTDYLVQLLITQTQQK